MNIKKKLAIYIPSYNRGSSLLKQLLAINSSIDKLKVDIVVKDNNSSDIGYKKVEEYCLENGFFYHKNFINIGADANIFGGFLEANRSEYIWILSDDDLLQEDAVSNILNILESNNLDILFFTHSKIESLDVQEWTQNNFYEQNIKTSDGAGLISNVIYRSEFIKESIPVGFQNIYTCFCHLAVLIDSFKNKNSQIGRIGSYKFFIPDTNLPAENSAGYSKSYFGFILLGDLFEDDIKKKFIKTFSSFYNLRHWYIKKRDNIAKQNCIYARGYIKSNIFLFNFFEMKLLFWFIFTPLLEFLKKTFSRNIKNKIFRFLKVKF